MILHKDENLPRPEKERKELSLLRDLFEILLGR